MILKNRIKELRARHGITQAYLAQEAGMNRMSISFIERGEREPSLLTALKIAEVLQVNISEIFYLENK